MEQPSFEEILLKAELKEKNIKKRIWLLTLIPIAIGLFFMLIFNAFQLSNWVENLLYGQSLIADPRKEIIVQRIALVLVSIGFFVEVVNSLRLLIASKRGSNLK